MMVSSVAPAAASTPASFVDMPTGDGPFVDRLLEELMSSTTEFSFHRYPQNRVMMTLPLILIGSSIAAAQHPPGGPEPPAVLAAPSKTPATPAPASGPVVEFLWE